MKIGIAGPAALNLLDFDFKGQKLPATPSFPLIGHLVNGLLKRGHSVVIYTVSSEIKEPFIFEDEKLTICVGRLEPHPGRDFYKSERKDLVQLMKQYPADVINAHWSYEFAWAAIDSGIPTVVTVRDHAGTILKYQFMPFRVVRWLMNYIVLTRAKYLTTNSDYLRQMLTKKQQKKTTVINNFYADGLEKHFMDSEIKSDYIVSINNGFTKRKNVENGLHAFAILRKKYPDLQYHLIGIEMEEGSFAYRYAQEHHLLDGVVFIGPKPFGQVIKTIKHAKIMLHTSREESFGNVVLEAMVVGTPVAGGNKSGNIPYLMDHGSAGILCDVDDPVDIAQGVMKILDNSAYASDLRLKAYAYATSNFSEDTIIERYISTYHKILNKNTTKSVAVF